MRVKINLQLLQRSLNKKIMILLDENWSKIKDFEEHIKRMFNLGDLQLEVYIGGFWIPGCEKICIIQPYDEVTVKEAPATSAMTYTSSNNATPATVDTERASVTTKEVIDDDASATEGKKLLSSKKQELLSKIQPVEHEEMDVADCGDNPPKKRKRKRKHKTTSNIAETRGIARDLPQTLPSVPASAKKTEVVVLRHGHIRFDNEEESETAVPESRSEEKQEDWHQKLLSLAQERKVVFTRQIATNGVNGVLHQETDPIGFHSQIKANGLQPSVAAPVDQAKPVDKVADHYVSTVTLPMESPRTSDLIYFKKLIMKNSIPTVSNFMLAVVEEIEDENMLTLKICVGHTDESFSAEELQESEGDSFIVKLPWSTIFEPRLVTDQQLLSEYL